MPTTIIWTALPHGPDGNSLSLSLFLSPRLSPSGSLGDAFAFSNDAPEPSGTNWPDRAGSVTFTLEFRDGVSAPGGASVTVDAAPDPSLLSRDLWSTLFPNTTPVLGHQLPDYASRTIRSYSVRGIHRSIQDLYHAIASDPVASTSFPSIGQGSLLGTFIEQLGRVARLMRDPPATDRGGYIPDDRILRVAGQLGLDYYHAHKFYNRAVDRTDYNSNPYNPRDASRIPARPSIPSIDFHGAIARMGDHPVLLRMLGLILDSTFDVSAVTVPPIGFVRVTNITFGTALAVPATHETPWTAYQRSAAGFLPRPLPMGSDIEDGLLKLGDATAFEAHEVDVDGAALSTLSFAFGVSRARDVISSSDVVREPLRIQPDTESLPALHSSGFTVARSGRRQTLTDHFSRATSANPALSSALLFADDITRGFRVDVLFRGTWYPICARNMSYDLGPVVGPVSVSDEGYIKAASATGPANPNLAAGVPNDLFLHESLFTWQGWSLVAPRPGRSITLNPGVDPPAYVDTSQPYTPYAIRPTVQVPPGTLPRLRFGDIYSFRARAADLAGNGHSWPGTIGPDWLSVPSTSWPSAPRTYVRWEPVSGPALVARAVIRPGESLETIVIRTQVGPYSLPASEFNATNERHVVPPKIAQILAEQHGMFDGLLADQVSAYRLARKEAGTLADRSFVDEDTGTLVAVPNIRLVVPPTVYGPDDVGAPWPALPGAPLGPGNYVLHVGDEIRTPYLPDPMAIGIALTGLPGSPSPITRRSYATNGSWPKTRAFRIVLNEAAGPDVTIAAPVPTIANEPITISAPRATIQSLRYSSLIDPANLPLSAGDPNTNHIFAVWESLTDAERAARAPAATSGQMWMLTPKREVKVVHAVERPIAAPQVDNLVALPRALGQTFQELQGRIVNHSRSSGSVEVRAQWTEEVDRIAESVPRFGVNAEPHDGHVFVRKIDYGEDAAFFAPTAPAVFPRHELGDTKHRFVRYFGSAETRYREYFGPAVTDDRRNITFEGPLSTPVNVLNTARPEPPRVLYMVPTFKWENLAGGTSRRVGRGLRLYLDRPWFSSGDGELLGVVVLAPPRLGGGPITELRKYVSQWGSDPVWSSDGPNVELDPSHFENARTTLDVLSVAENPDLAVSAIGFNVEFNAERKLWFAEIVFRAQPSYYPFVRLAVARLQPDSITNAHLSPIVRTEFMQLVSDRTATVTVSVSGRVRVIDVTVFGPTAVNEIGQQESPTSQPPPAPPYRPLFAAGKGHAVMAHLESRNRGSTNEFDWQAGSPIRLDSYVLEGSTDVYWKGQFRTAPPLEGVQVRLVVRELEIFNTDPETAEAGLPVSFDGRNIPIRGRLVYLDYLPVF